VKHIITGGDGFLGTELAKKLVARGEKVQDQAQSRIKEGRDTIEERVDAVKGRFTKLSFFSKTDKKAA